MKTQTAQTSINCYKENPSQKTRILLYLKEGKTLTPLQALDLFGCFRLGARIWDIKKMDIKIETKFIKTNSGAVVAEYSLGKNYVQGKLF
ncbi:hypothetical protein LCGC14_1345610 [marine sediment metagenome]|uniref:Winged helix-turn-helix domain-containing protein n=1 Tax=marine sediment metagenome TaxID=412755 RepID=A0A0F9KYN8_9ZZZZ